MSLISIDNLTFSYPGSCTNVFEHINAQFDTDWRLALVGRNGRGKTTLLRLLTQQETEYSGAIRGVPPCVYFPAAVRSTDQSAADVVRSISPSAMDWQVDRELSLIGLRDETAGRAFSSLSEGERTKVLLAALFLTDGALPLIDEPTNHLDVEGRAAVAQYLRRKHGFVLVSHDRAFLDASTDHVLAVNRSSIDVQKGSFSAWFEAFSRQQEAELQRTAHLNKEIGRLENTARRAAAWSARAEKEKRHLSDGLIDRGFASRRAAKIGKRARAAEVRSSKAAEEKKKLLQNIERADTLQISALRHPKDVLVRLTDLAPVYDGVPVCAPVSLELHRGDRIFLTGVNGSGKSTILRAVLGVHTSYTGELQRASGLCVSVILQDSQRLSGTPEAYARAAGVDLSLMLSIAVKLGMDRKDFASNLASMSEGQKKKMMVARSLCEKAHLYVWDEPLNYLDVYARVQIEQMIRASGAAMLLVEHDKAFRNAVGTAEIQLSQPEQVNAGTGDSSELLTP